MDLIKPPATQTDIVNIWLQQYKTTTLSSYRSDLRSFQRFMAENYANGEALILLLASQGTANRIGLEFRADMLEQGLAPATINRRLAALKSLCNVANVMGLIPWRLNVKGVPLVQYRETMGPGVPAISKLIKTAESQTNPKKAARDPAILALLYTLGLRRGEVISINREDYDGKHLYTCRKGGHQKSKLTVPTKTKPRLDAWLAIRGDAKGPLFHRLDLGGQSPKRITGASIDRLLKILAKKAGLDPTKIRAHGLRHTAITQLLELTGGDVRAVQKFSGHKKVTTLERYDDIRRDVAGELAEKL